NEPTAAALAFGEDLGYLKKSADAPDDRIYVLVYDLGGGTFDATIIEMQAGDLRTVATDGDVRLGGRDWDDVLVEYVAREFQEKCGSDPLTDRVSHQRLLVAVEEAKHTLSARNSAHVKVTHDGKTLDVKLTREVFEAETEHLLERTAYVARQLLTASGLQWSDLGRILQVGGSTRMPMVARMLEERTGIRPDHKVNPDEAVARGAALYADFLMASRDESGREQRFQITNVNSHSLGIEGVDPKTGRKGNNIIISKNSALPARKQKRFETKREGQRSVVVKVLEGESPNPDECTPIGKTVIRQLPDALPAGSPIWVTYEYGSNGRLNVWAKVQGTDREVHLELEREGSLSGSVIKQWQGVLLGEIGLTGCGAVLRGDNPPPEPSQPASPVAQPTAGPPVAPAAQPPAANPPAPAAQPPATNPGAPVAQPPAAPLPPTAQSPLAAAPTGVSSSPNASQAQQQPNAQPAEGSAPPSGAPAFLQTKAGIALSACLLVLLWAVVLAVGLMIGQNL
ncbi:MAG: Hsp70 family protein, partial [Planctomycetales bacterium]